jgi:hypothetical protein
MSEILDAPGLPCIICELTICGEPHWSGDAGPLCETCYTERAKEFFGALEDILARILSGDADRETPLPQPQETRDE